MKRLLCCLVAVSILSGCGSPAATSGESATVSTAAVSAALTASPSPSAPVSAEEPSAVEAMLSAEEPEPTPTPTPTPVPKPDSLTELLPEGPKVVFSGTEVPSLLLGGTTLVRLDDLADLASWLVPETTGETLTLETLSGEAITETCTLVDGVETPISDAMEGSCIFFDGNQQEYWLPVRAYAEKLGLVFLWDEENWCVYLQSPILTDLILTGSQVPVLMYHAVSDDLWGIDELFVSPSDLQDQLQYLLDNGYDPIFFSDLPHLEDYDKPILLTFDDGYEDNYTELYPILQALEVKATVFVITGMLGDEHYMTANNAREMSDSGLVDIQSHTVTHRELVTLSYEEQDTELSQSRLELARITGKIPTVIAYPSGSRDENTLELAPQYYSLGIDMIGGLWTVGPNYFKVDRIYISRYAGLSGFIASLP